MKEKYLSWLSQVKDEELFKELKSFENDNAEIEDRFYQNLAFGTGGLRGVIGAGTNRMNIYTVGRATFGFADYLLNKFKGEEIKVAIAYDSRNKSSLFALTVAEILSSKGINAYLFSVLTPTPVLSFAVRYLKANAGVVITASHNPKEYNGYKVYNQFGCQITDNAAKEITSYIDANEYFKDYKPNKDKIIYLDDKVKNAFLDTIESYSFEKIDSSLSVVYTPLNGAGKEYVKEILLRKGVKNLHIVSEQENPDPFFTTCPYPNPEEKDALTLALRDAKKLSADIILATDPDSDRLGVIVKHNEEFVLLSGNEIGVILTNYLFSRKSELNILGDKPCIIKTIVSTDMAKPIALKYGGIVKEVLTGFKYIGEQMDKTENYLFGFEESYGYLLGEHARDKDAVVATSLMIDAVSYYRSKNKTLIDLLDDLYLEFGYYGTQLTSFAFKGAFGMDKMKNLLSGLRGNPITTLLNEKAEMLDYSQGILNLPKSNVLQFKSSSYKVTVRPSGTEPKLKIYFEVKAQTKKALEQNKLALIDEILNRLNLK